MLTQESCIPKMEMGHSYLVSPSTKLIHKPLGEKTEKSERAKVKVNTLDKSIRFGGKVLKQ